MLPVIKSGGGGSAFAPESGDRFGIGGVSVGALACTPCDDDAPEAMGGGGFGCLTLAGEPVLARLGVTSSVLAFDFAAVGGADGGLGGRCVGSGVGSGGALAASFTGGGGFCFVGGLSLATFPPPASWGSAGPLAHWPVVPKPPAGVRLTPSFVTSIGVYSWLAPVIHFVIYRTNAEVFYIVVFFFNFSR